MIPLFRLMKLSHKAREAYLEKNADKKVYIFSGEHNAYWRPNNKGYCYQEEAGVYTLREAFAASGHCDESKKIYYIGVPPPKERKLTKAELVSWHIAQFDGWRKIDGPYVVIDDEILPLYQKFDAAGCLIHGGMYNMPQYDDYNSLVPVMIKISNEKMLVDDKHGFVSIEFTTDRNGITHTDASISTEDYAFLKEATSTIQCLREIICEYIDSKKMFAHDH